MVQSLFALIRDEWGAASPGIKQAQSFYQFAFFDRRWIDDYHQQFARVITQKCLASDTGTQQSMAASYSCDIVQLIEQSCLVPGIPIFLLNVSLSRTASLADQMPDTLVAIATSVAKVRKIL